MPRFPLFPFACVSLLYLSATGCDQSSTNNERRQHASSEAEPYPIEPVMHAASPSVTHEVASQSDVDPEADEDNELAAAAGSESSAGSKSEAAPPGNLAMLGTKGKGSPTNLGTGVAIVDTRSKPTRKANSSKKSAPTKRRASTKLKEDVLAQGPGETKQAKLRVVTRKVKPELKTLALDLLKAFKSNSVSALKPHFPSTSDGEFMVQLRIKANPDMDADRQAHMMKQIKTFPSKTKAKIKKQFASVRTQCEKAGVNWSDAKIVATKTGSEVDWGITKGHLVMTIESQGAKFSLTVEDSRLTPDRLMVGHIEYCSAL